MHVVSLEQFRNQKLVAVLRELLELAEEGEIQGLVFVAKFGAGDHRAGAAGDYKRKPEEALSATFTMERYLMRGQAPFERSTL